MANIAHFLALQIHSLQLELQILPFYVLQFITSTQFSGVHVSYFKSDINRNITKFYVLLSLKTTDNT